MKGAWIGLLALSLGCNSSAGVAESPTPSGSLGVTQSGPQDAAHFRSLVEDGKVPEPAVLDQVGFFAEHALDQAAADCGQVVCTHPSLAVAPRFDDGAWTMAFVSLNSPVDPAERARQPVHVVLAVESSEELRGVVGDGSSLLGTLSAALTAGDRFSVVQFGEGAEVLVEAAEAGADVSAAHLASGDAVGAVDLYAGLAASAEVLSRHTDSGFATRLVLVTSGQANTGISEPGLIAELAEGIVRDGTPISVLGAGDDFAAALPRAIAEIGSGNYAFAESGGDLEQLVEEEAGIRLVPVATEVELRLAPSPGYRVGRIYGAARATVEEGEAVLRFPALFLGTRSSATDASQGRRGGGGGFFVELLADAERADDIGAQAPAFRVSMAYTDADAQAKVSYEQVVDNDLAPGIVPDENWPHFSQPDYGKAFMMLNMYLALRAMLDLYQSGDCGEAQGVSQMMQPGVDEWQRRFADPDIGEDGRILSLLRQNIEDACRATPRPPSNYEAGCFAL